ncbi:hypothetical protein evm_003147 [Chilo suppressalis]|nr:hypothetical protein evm_003147 [Chilo suppressalis]
MEEAFEKLKKEGKNDVDNLVKWMKDSKVIDNTKAMEEKARALLAETANKQSVELAKFKEALGKLAADQKKSFEDLSKKLLSSAAKEASAFSKAFSSGVSAFKEAWAKRDK